MTRKDYQLIADTLRRAKPGSDYQYAPVNTDTDVQWRVTCGLVAGALATDNPRFNHDIFFAAIGIG